MLPGDDGDGAPIGQQSAGFSSVGRRLTPLLLPGDDGGDLLAAPIVRLRAGDGVGPRSRIRGIARVERRDRAKIVRVVGGEAANPREAPNIDRYACGRLIGHG